MNEDSQEPGEDGTTGCSCFESPLLAARKALAQRDVHTALALFQRAEAAGVSADDCAAGRWDCHMLLGDFRAAWRESAAIEARGTPDPHRFWNGTCISGKRVMLRSLHGFGDCIQFIRYAPYLKQEAARLTIEAAPSLRGLLRMQPYFDEAVSWGEHEGSSHRAWDVQMEIMELPRMFHAEEPTIPRNIPYLHIDHPLVQRSRENLGGSGETKVGIAWASGEWNPTRNMPLEALADLLDVKKCRFYSLQGGAGRSDIRALGWEDKLVDTVDFSPTLLETAADISVLDLIVTVDTVYAHLAGALGRPVWVLLQHQADWRWMLNRCDSPWYPTMRLFRQSRPGDWPGVVADVRRALLEFIAARGLASEPGFLHAGSCKVV